MAQIRKGETIKVDGEKLDKTIREIEGKNYKGMKISTFILQRDVSYYSKVIRTGVCNKDDFKKLCEYYEINPNDHIIVEPSVEAISDIQTPKEVVNIDKLIVGINNMYAMQRDNNEIMAEILQALETANNKLNVIAGNLVPIKDSINTTNDKLQKQSNTLSETRSTVATIQGRVKDLLDKFKN